MKRFSCNDSINALLYPSPGEMMKGNENGGYSREFQAMLDGLDEEDSIEESGQSSSDKKRRLSNHQVKSLEKIFEVDNKLDPERKIKVAHDLALQPRQVAIWFQNRRARWKTKQLERDYNILKNNYDALKLNFQKMEQEKENLAAQLKELKDKFSESSEKTETNEFHTKEKALFWGSHNNGMDSSYSIELCGEPETEPEPEPEAAKTNHELYQSLNLDPTNGFMDLKDGSSDSDSSGVLNEDTTNLIHDQLLISPPAFTSPRFFDLSSLNYSQFLDSRSVLTKGYQQEQMVKMEEQCLVTSSDESCNIFSVDQAPTLCWYFPEQRN